MVDRWRLDFETALGESFCDYVCPPVPDDFASPHECCEAIWLALGDDVNPEMMASLDRDALSRIAAEFGHYFECEPPSLAQINEAVQATIARWPAT